MSRVILVRHGETRSNVQGLLDTAIPGAELTPTGRRQADALVGVLADERIDRVVASPLARTVQTATPIAAARGLDLATDAGLREVLAGELELRADREAHLRYLGTVLAWATGDLAATVPGAPETGETFFERFDRAIATALEGADSVLCVSHGAAIRAWASARAVNVPDDFGAEHGLPNTGVVILDRVEGDWLVDRWTDRRIPAAESDPTGAALP